MIEATRPTPLAELEMGQAIRPGLDWPEGGSGEPVQLPDLMVVEKRQTAEGFTVFCQPVAKERRRRVTVRFAPGETAHVVAGDDDLAKIRDALAWAIAGKGPTEAIDTLAVRAVTAGVLTVELNGWTVTL